MPPARSGRARRQPNAISARSPLRFLILGAGGKLFPIFSVLSPLRNLVPGDLQFGLGQGAVTVSADIFDTRAAQLQHSAPGAGFDRHAQLPQADAASVPLVQENRV